MFNFSFIPDAIVLESNIDEKSIFWKFSDLYHPIHGWLSSIVCTFGIILNFLNIIVLTRRNMVNISFQMFTVIIYHSVTKGEKHNVIPSAIAKGTKLKLSFSYFIKVLILLNLNALDNV